ncbi:hypothetical protein ABB37_05869 [Leptomonas pyrrhocoris]|uniref:Uncharacterized protein n=1 Tax=Leptomonas pyrrhocoris TaxID=157538 RepID=A0A0N0VEL4_LEPPY|nr:hypothetical protein ABB37_05869 [Leptomonas pyrrhocoris]XP_015657191.1 hypothetical protein ABB37_05869 [Leptomonas pyrrhocoris]KPA78751.1 hypothetical protein ABB37_05869 [Leptomonas pyrrhocoris]KPA78752.1 hypothetical protein ABB37_05869 [Leptomonas pyrrhocoris]|eukprot:XP_015657190.1 hypothetical protein ABB37_05869 [Leptomonas pyrrhocoris]
MRNPLRFVQHARATAEDEYQHQQQQHIAELMRVEVDRHQLNFISASRIQAFVKSRSSLRTVLGVAVLSAEDITAEEHANVAVYFEAVAPDGTAWMEGLAAPSPLSSPLSSPSSQRGETRQGTAAKRPDVGHEPDASKAADTWWTLRPSSAASSRRTRNTEGGSKTEAKTASAAFPTFASYGAANVTRRRKRTARVSSHKTLARQTSEDALNRRVRRNGRAPSAVHPTEQDGDSHQLRAVTTQKAAHIIKQSTKREARVDEATIVFTDPCVAALPGSDLAAFTKTLQNVQKNVVVRAIFPDYGDPHTALSRNTDPFRARRTPSTGMSEIAAHVLSAISAAQGVARRTLDQAVVLRTAAVDEHVQQCVQEAKVSQRPRFRRRTSLEVYGRGSYTTAQ